MTSVRRCENCKWWERIEDDYGVCHFNPPVVTENLETGPWPPCVASDWCREMTPRDDA
jgi:hypothetical protein